MIERSGQGVDKIYYNNLAEGKSLPDYSESDAYQVVLKLKAEIVDPAFYLFIKNEQMKRDGNNQLSVFHLLALHNIKIGNTDNVNEETLNELVKEGLIIRTTDSYRLNDNYEAMKIRARKNLVDNTNEKINEKIKLTERQIKVFTFIMDNQPVNARGIADILKIPLGTVYRILGFLSSQEVELVEHIGSNKTGGYQLTVKGNSFKK